MDTSSPGSRSKSLRTIGVIFVVIVGIYAAAPFLINVAPSPVANQLKIAADEIYSAVDRTRKIPEEIALPHLARVGMSQFVRILPLDDAVEDRVRARLDGVDFVDELVPFLLMLKDMYMTQEDQRLTTFDEHLRNQYSPNDDIPGMEHSMFTWVPAADSTGKEQQKATGGGLDLELAAKLVTLYDALYLVGQDDAGRVFDRLACTDAEIDARLRSSIDRVEPAVRNVLQQVRDGMASDSEIALALDGILQDPERTQTVTLSLIHFMDLMVCKHYQMFASRVHREQQLKNWLSDELMLPAGGKSWQYLEQAQHERRYGVLIAVDGLQGHLLEGLATDAQENPFIQAIATEQVQGMARVKSADEKKLAQQSEFLALLAADGFQHADYLPFFKDLYAYSGATDTVHPLGVAVGGISTTPTISVRNLPVIKTGAPVAGEGSTGVPNFHFVDRTYEHDGELQGRAYYFFGNDALQLTRLTQTAGMQTLFQRLPGRSSYSCAAQYDDYAQAGIDPFLNLALGEAIRDFGELLCFQELSQRAQNEGMLQDLRSELLSLRDRLAIEPAWFHWYQRWDRNTARERATQLIGQIAAYESMGMPELLVYYNPWPDHFAHFTGPFADEVLAPSGELARLDYWLGQLITLYQQAGVVDRTLFGMAGDHGLAPVFELVSPQAVVLDALIAEGVPMEVIKISSDEGEGPKLTNALAPPSMRGYDVVVASTAGGNLMFDFFVDQAANWARQPIESELRNWQPQAWQQAGLARHVDLLAEMVGRLGTSLEYLVVRTANGNNAQQTDIALYGPGGSAQLTRRGDRILYQFDGADLLRLATLSRYAHLTEEDRVDHHNLYQQCVEHASLDTEQSWCDEAEWRALASYTEKPDSVVQLAHLYDSDRAGTVNLFPANGVAYNSIVPGRHAGESFHEKDAFAGVWGAPVQARTLHRPPYVLGGTIPMTIFEYLQDGPSGGAVDGWGYPSLWAELLESQSEIAEPAQMIEH